MWCIVENIFIRQKQSEESRKVDETSEKSRRWLEYVENDLQELKEKKWRQETTENDKRPL
jgi:hypothetical protein